MVNEVLTDDNAVVNGLKESEIDAVVDESTEISIEVIKFADYTALDVVQLLSICFVPFFILIVSYGMMRILSMRVSRL